MTRHGTQKFRYNQIAFQVDIGRQMETPATLRKIITYGASLGYNAVYLYGEGSLEYKSHPECSGPWALKQRDYVKLAKYAATHGMELTPIIPMLGHANYILDNESMAHLQEVKTPEQAVMKCGARQFCTSMPESYRVMEDLLGEWAAISAAPCLHIGGDESWSFATCPECRARAKAVGRGRMLAEHFNRVNAIVKKHGKTTMIWHDMLFYYAGALDFLDQDIIICDWHYKPVERYPGISIYNWVKTDSLSAYERRGLKYFICPRANRDYFANAENVKTLIEYAERRPPEGLLNTVWEMSFMPFASCYPSLAYGAACCRREAPPEPRAFLHQFARKHFSGDPKLLPMIADILPDTACGFPTGVSATIDYQNPFPKQYLAGRFKEAAGLAAKLKPITPPGNMYLEAVSLLLRRGAITAELHGLLNETARMFLPGRRFDKSAILDLLRRMESWRGLIPGQLKLEGRVWGRYRPRLQENPAATALTRLFKDVSGFIPALRRAVNDGKKAVQLLPTVLELTLVNNDCSWQYLSIFTSPDGKKYRKLGSWPQCGPFGRYVKVFPLSRRAKYIKLELTGLGQILLHYARIIGPGYTAVPCSLLQVAGKVANPEHLLVDDFRPVIMGDVNSRQYFSKGREQPPAIIEFEMRPLET